MGVVPRKAFIIVRKSRKEQKTKKKKYQNDVHAPLKPRCV